MNMTQGTVAETTAEKTAEEIKNMITIGFENFEAGTHYSYKTIGGLLGLMRDGKKYKELGHKNMNEFVASIGRSRSICYSMMDYHDHVVPMLEKNPELMNIPVTSLCKELMPLIRMSSVSVETLSELSTLSDNDMKDEIRRLRGKKTHINCDHENTEGWIRCIDCGKFMKAK